MPGIDARRPSSGSVGAGGPGVDAAFDAMALELLARGESLTFTARGASMRPFLCDGDRLTVAPLHVPPRLGDVVLVRGASLGVVHRVVARRGGRVLTKGDALPATDGWRAETDVLGRVVEVQRGGRRVPVGRWLAVAVSLGGGLARRLLAEHRRRRG